VGQLAAEVREKPEELSDAKREFVTEIEESAHED
jgi:hypothetical protein